MVLSETDISKLLKEPRNAKAIASGISLQRDHKHHVTGEGYQSLVKKVEGYESNEDYDNVKKQIAKPATILITSIILDNLNRWTNAQGTVKKVNFNDPNKDEQFQQVLNQCWNNKSFEDFINTFVKEAIYTDFNGFTLVTKPAINTEEKTIDREGIVKAYEGGNVDPYMIFIALEDVHDYYLTGDKVEYLIIKLDKEHKKFRVIDDEKDAVVEYSNERANIINIIPNEPGYVPARMVSNINENILNNQVKTSPINHIIPALDRYMSCDCDLRMQYIKHLYPKLAIVSKDCPDCANTGKVHDPYDDTIYINCQRCKGSGKIIPISRDGVIGLPDHLIAGDTPYPGAPATYIDMETESLRLAAEDLEKQRLDIIYAGTGDKNIIAESLNTATENIINSRSLEDRIAEISTMVEQLEVFLKKAIKDLHKDFASIEDYEIIVKYGKKIAFKNEDELLREIKAAKDSGMNLSYIQSLQVDLIYVRYKNNKTELERQLLLNDIEPFAGYTIDEVLKMKEYIDPQDLKLKINFESLIDQLEKTQPIEAMTLGEGYKSKLNQIKEQLYGLLPKTEKPVPVEQEPIITE
jgi:hypothetical protein